MRSGYWPYSRILFAWARRLARRCTLAAFGLRPGFWPQGQSNQPTPLALGSPPGPDRPIETQRCIADRTRLPPYLGDHRLGGPALRGA
jgi:hypothetical protein